MTKVEFAVSGPSLRAFPVDMLRYDGVIPATEGDAHLIVESIEERYVGTAESAKTVRSIRLARYFHSVREAQSWVRFGPAVGRWESFGWKVAEAARVVY